MNAPTISRPQATETQCENALGRDHRTSAEGRTSGPSRSRERPLSARSRRRRGLRRRPLYPADSGRSELTTGTRLHTRGSRRLIGEIVGGANRDRTGDLYNAIGWRGCDRATPRSSALRRSPRGGASGFSSPQTKFGGSRMALACGFRELPGSPEPSKDDRCRNAVRWTV